MFQEKAKILWNNRVGPVHYRMGITCPAGYLGANPGQFIMLRISDQAAPLLRRPFSIHRLIVKNGDIEGIELLYRVVGECTRKLSTFKKGDCVDMLGPLGRGFRIPDTCHHIFIVAGGIGVAPMLFLASSINEKGASPSGCSVFIGGKSNDELVCKDDFSAFNMPVHITTEDGSAGDQGLITQPLEMRMRKNPPDIIYACGPPGMLKRVTHIAETHKVSCQISIETMMACGMGACLGCAVENKKNPNKYWHACLDGPVFDAREVEL